MLILIGTFTSFHILAFFSVTNFFSITFFHNSQSSLLIASFKLAGSNTSILFIFVTNFLPF